MKNHLKKYFLVCGTGSIGQRHIENLISLNENIIIWRERKKKNLELKKKFPGIKYFEKLNKALKFCDAVIICNSTNKHIGILKSAIKLKKHFYIEKPISNKIEDLNKINLSPKNVIGEVGYQFRSHPNLIFLKNKLRKSNSKIFSYRFVMGHNLKFWRKNHKFTESYTNDVKKGGGALFELIHQVDLAIWLFGPIKKVTGYRSKVSRLKINADDLSNLILIHKNGIAGQIQLDMVSPLYRCEAEIVTSKEILLWSYTDGKITQRNKKKNKIIHKLTKSFKRNDLFINSMKHFVERVYNKKKVPLCDLKEGSKSLIAIDSINKKLVN